MDLRKIGLIVYTDFITNYGSSFRKQLQYCIDTQVELSRTIPGEIEPVNAPDSETGYFSYIAGLAVSIRESWDIILKQCMMLLEDAKVISDESTLYNCAIHILEAIRRFNQIFGHEEFGRFELSTRSFTLTARIASAYVKSFHVSCEPVNLAINLDGLFSNLIVNSLMHAFDDSIPTENRAVSISGAFESDGSYKIIYRDNGKGMTFEQLEKVFIEGESGKEGHDGGIAMHYWQHRLRCLGGNLEVESSEGRGAAFTITISSDMIF